MLIRAREALLLLLILCILPLAANAQQFSVEAISGDTWSKIIKVESPTPEQLMAMSSAYMEKGAAQSQAGDRSNGLTNALISLSMAKYVQKRKFDQKLNASVKKLQDYLESVGVEQSVIIASEGTLTSYLKGQSTALTTIHQYIVFAAGIDGRPLAGVVVEIELNAKGSSAGMRASHRQALAAAHFILRIITVFSRSRPVSQANVSIFRFSNYWQNHIEQRQFNG